MKSKYTLSHNRGEAYFQTIQDAITAMYLVADYDKDCGLTTELTGTKKESDQIKQIVEAGEYYINGFLTLFISE